MRWLVLIAAGIVGIAAMIAIVGARHQKRGRGGGAPLIFEDMTERAGIKFKHFNAPRASLLPEDVGSGTAWGDYDNDGDDDLYVVNFAGPLLMERAELQKRDGNRLYRNNGDGTFTDVTEEAGVGNVGWNYACLWFDYDGDGSLDLAVTHFEGARLYRNLGNGRFEDVTQSTGLSKVRKFLLGMAAADYDHDGDLDLYLCGYVKFDREKAKNRPLVAGRPAVWTNPVSFPAETNVLLKNNGDGTFTDVTAQAGVANPEGKSMQALFCDLDNDGWADLYVCNDVATADVLFRNKQDGTFEEVSLEAGTHDSRAGMGVTTGDLWHRGWMDLFVTHWVDEDHALWKNVTQQFKGKSPMAFDDVGVDVGLGYKPSAYVGWGCGLYDFDNDSHLDLMVFNGSTIEDELTVEVLSNPKLLPQSAHLFWWDAKKSGFKQLGGEAGRFFKEPHISRGAAFGDYDRDGKVDAVVVQRGEKAQLLHNESPAGNYLTVKVVGAEKNKFGIGAKVRVTANGVTATRQIVCGSSYLANDMLAAHFGLDDATTAEVEVVFPSGKAQRLDNVGVNKILTVKE